MRFVKVILIILFTISIFYFHIKTVVLFLAFFVLGILYQSIKQDRSISRVQNRQNMVENSVSIKKIEGKILVSHKTKPIFRSEDIF